MSRSVSTHRHAVETVYLHDPCGFSEMPSYEAECFGQDHFADFIHCLRGILRARFTSLSSCDRWQDREDHVILEDQRGEVSVSEYCNLVAVCLAPLDPDSPLDRNWCDQVSKTFGTVLAKAFPNAVLVPMGRASNGEQFFRPATRPEGLVTSKEGELW